MTMRVYWILVLIACFTVGAHYSSQAQASGDSATTDEYNSIQTLLCLNYAMESLCKIISYNDIVVLDQEYNNIINNINASKIIDDEITSLFQELMDRLTAQTIQDTQKKKVADQYARQIDSAITTAITNAASGVSLVSFNPFSAVSSAVYGVGSGYFNYRKNISAYKQQEDESLWQIEQQVISDLNNIRKRFFSTTVNLTNKYSWPDEYRLSEEQVNDYVEALKDTEPERRYRKLERMQNDFSVFPPFWYYLGLAAQENNNKTKALECYSKFEETSKGIFRKDPLLAAMSINRLVLLGSSASAQQIHQALENILSNSRKDDWSNRLFVASQYALLKEYDKADKCLIDNIDDGYDISLHSRLRAELKLENKLPEEYRSITEEMIGDPGVYFQDILHLFTRTGDARLLESATNDIANIGISFRSHLLGADDIVLSIPLRLLPSNVMVALVGADGDIPYTSLEVSPNNDSLYFIFANQINVTKYLESSEQIEATFRLAHNLCPIETTFCLGISSQTKKSGRIGKLLGSEETYEEKSIDPRLVKVKIQEIMYKLESGKLTT